MDESPVFCHSGAVKHCITTTRKTKNEGVKESGGERQFHTCVFSTLCRCVYCWYVSNCVSELLLFLAFYRMPFLDLFIHLAFCYTHSSFSHYAMMLGHTYV